jgi:hypothetical protein
MKRAILAVLALSFGTNLNASSISIDFESLANSEFVFNQYASDGVLFRNSVGGSPGQIIPIGYNSNKSLGVSNAYPGVFILFPDIAVYFVSTYVQEAPIPEPEPEPLPEPEPEPGPLPEPQPEPEPEPEPEPAPEGSVYLYLFELLQDGSYNLLDTAVDPVQAIGTWHELSFSSEVPIAAIQVLGTQPFYLDNILISTTPAPVPVSEPPTVLLLGSVLVWLVGLRRKIRKNCGNKWGHPLADRTRI